MNKKRILRISASLMSLVILLCANSFATSSSETYNGGTVYYYCNAGSSGSAATTEYSNSPIDLYTSLDVSYDYYSGSVALSGTDYDDIFVVTGTAYVSLSYPTSYRVTALSDHTIDNATGTSLIAEYNG